MVTVRGPDVLPVDWTAVLSDRPATPLKQLIVPLVRPSPGSLRFTRERFRRRCGTRMRGEGMSGGVRGWRGASPRVGVEGAASGAAGEVER